MPFFGWRLTENFSLYLPLLCQNRVHQNDPSFSSGRRDFSLFFPIKHFSNWLKKKYIILIILLVFSIKNQKFPLWGYMGQFGAVSGGTGLIEIYAHFTKLYFYPYRFQFYTGYSSLPNRGIPRNAHHDALPGFRSFLPWNFTIHHDVSFQSMPNHDGKYFLLFFFFFLKSSQKSIWVHRKNFTKKIVKKSCHMISFMVYCSK